MLTIYLTRHGQTEWNLERRMQGWGNAELTSQGLQDAAALEKRLNNLHFDAIYTSTSKRAYHTAEIIAANRKVEIIKDDLFREMSFGDWEGRIIKDIEKEFPAEYKSFWETPHLYTRDQGEQFSEVQKRTESALKLIMKNHPSGTVLVVAHSIFLRILIAYINGIPLEHLFKQKALGHTSLTKAIVEDRKPKIVFEGDMSHVEH
ncbi:histidine phosphatase family protein [Peribacillus saganii]|uniref:Histidine phosphatase family protein n=1 Tax=Peribacillus saganii TaxID=2303992 RepID=A0A372LKV6_9BACI|nr:histidine phosphatase family protein [Peribacillus saganii]RFU67397.1 histidine phosphatase family protein [Peribacillus saganii]